MLKSLPCRQRGQLLESSRSHWSTHAWWKTCLPAHGNTRRSSPSSKSTIQIGQVSRPIESGMISEFPLSATLPPLGDWSAFLVPTTGAPSGEVVAGEREGPAPGELGISHVLSDMDILGTVTIGGMPRDSVTSAIEVAAGSSCLVLRLGNSWPISTDSLTGDSRSDPDSSSVGFGYTGFCAPKSRPVTGTRLNLMTGNVSRMARVSPRARDWP